jgi:hypothetical protein
MSCHLASEDSTRTIKRTAAGLDRHTRTTTQDMQLDGSLYVYICDSVITIKKTTRKVHRAVAPPEKVICVRSNRQLSPATRPRVRHMAFRLPVVSLLDDQNLIHWSIHRAELRHCVSL